MTKKTEILLGCLIFNGYIILILKNNKIMANQKAQFQKLMLKYKFISENYLYLIDKLYESEFDFYYYFHHEVLESEVECNISNKEIKKLFRQFNKLNELRNKK